MNDTTTIHNYSTEHHFRNQQILTSHNSVAKHHNLYTLFYLKHLFAAYFCTTFSAVISQGSLSPLSALTFLHACYLKKGSSTKCTAIGLYRRSNIKMRYRSTSAATLLPHLCTEEILVIKRAELHLAEFEISL